MTTYRVPHLVFVLACLPTLTSAAEPVTTDGRVVSVTVYQGQALVTREVALDAAGGLTEVVVTNLPDKVQPGSLYAEPEDGVEIRSVRYRVRPVEQDVRAEVRELDEQIQLLQDKLRANDRQRKLLGERSKYLQKLEGFTTVTATHELKSGVLNAETLKSLTEFVFQERSEIAERELKATIEQRELKRELEVLARKRSAVTQGSAKTVREAVVFADLGAQGAKSLRLTYLVSNASWSPSYNLRADNKQGRVVVEYNASIQQRSGEDWTNVVMTLSTASPSLVSSAPMLDPLTIRLAPPTPEQQSARQDYFKAKTELAQKQRQLAQLRNSAGNFADADADLFMPFPQSVSAMSGEAPQMQGGQMLAANQPADRGVRLRSAGGLAGGGGFGYRGNQAADLRLNDFGDKMQLLEFNSTLKKAAAKVSVRPREQGISVSYNLVGKTSLPSRSDRQLIQIASLPLEGDFYHIATPVLSEYVYREAMLANASDMVLLSGPTSTFLNGEFVGRGAMPTVSVGEAFRVGLGIDAALRAGRELVEKKSDTQGGNRVVVFDYQLTIENFGSQEVDVRLFDRLPKADGSDIKITLIDAELEVSPDEAYQKQDRKNGILRWDLKAPAGATGINQKTLGYKLQIEYDRQLQIVGLK